MPRIPRRRTKVSFTGQLDIETLEAIEKLATTHNRSMADVLRRLATIGLECTDQGATMFTSQRRLSLAPQPQEDD